MRRSSAFLLLVATAPAHAQAFGRFGYVPLQTVPGFSVSLTGFRARQESADLFKFISPASSFRVVTASATEQVVVPVGVGGGIIKVRASLLGNSLDLFVRNGLKLRIGTTSSPYLTWSEGSVNNGVPTPKIPWVGLSFLDRQPPIALGFSGQSASVAISGRPGDWVLTVGKISGWIRVHLPVGTDPLGGASASSLGRFAKILDQHQNYWGTETPELLKVSAQSDPDGVDVTYTFNRKAAIVPRYALLSALGGYRLKTQTKWVELPGRDEEGPRAYLAEPTLKIRFPVRAVQRGRAIGLGNPIEATEPGDRNPSRVTLGEIVSQALRLPISTTSVSEVRAAENSLSEFLGTVPMALEPLTGQMLPYESAGTGLAEVAANALALQSLKFGEPAKQNGLLTSLHWRLDWASGLLTAENQAVRRRASAIAAIAYAFSAEPNDRWTAGVLEAGLAAERGRAVDRNRRDAVTVPKFLEPLPELRQALFATEVSPAENYLKLLQSPLRTPSDYSLVADDRGRGISLMWSVSEPSFGTIELTGADVIASPLTNLTEVKKLGDRFSWRAESAGTCEMLVQSPPLPKWVLAPRYSETLR